jgi:hypothetical protein
MPDQSFAQLDVRYGRRGSRTRIQGHFTRERPKEEWNATSHAGDGTEASADLRGGASLRRKQAVGTKPVATVL